MHVHSFRLRPWWRKLNLRLLKKLSFSIGVKQKLHHFLEDSNYQDSEGNTKTHNVSKEYAGRVQIFRWDIFGRSETCTYEESSVWRSRYAKNNNNFECFSLLGFQGKQQKEGFFIWKNLSNLKFFGWIFVERSQTFSYVDGLVWMSRWVNIKNVFFSDCQDCEKWLQVKHSPNKSFCNNWSCWFSLSWKKSHLQLCRKRSRNIDIGHY